MTAAIFCSYRKRFPADAALTDTAMEERIVKTCALSVFLLAISTIASAETPVFNEPPDPETLAQLLFEPRYRSSDGQPVENLFAMRIQFEFDSTAVVPESLPLLDSVGEMMALPQVRGRSIVVEGHTDARGTDAYNDSLSQRRAAAIKQYLADAFDIDASRLVVTGKGERSPHDRADPHAPINRRVVFKPLQKIRLK